MLDESLDPAVLAVLPPGSEVIEVHEHGTASWSSGYKVDVEVNGEEKEYFLKVLQRHNHVEMARGEYESQKALAEIVPDNVALPLAHGTFQRDSSKSFFITPFRELMDKIATPTALAELLKALHTTSRSPTGKFGFHVQTFNGVVPVINDWCDTWEAWFTRQFKADILWEQSVCGPDPEFDAVADEFFAKKVILFDSCCCYGHNELDLHMMREPRYKFSEKQRHLIEYKRIVGVSEPVEDFDDRNALYAMRDNIINSGLHEHRRFLRQKVKEEMQRLLAKYPEGFEGFKRSRGSEYPSQPRPSKEKLFWAILWATALLVLITSYYVATLGRPLEVINVPSSLKGPTPDFATPAREAMEGGVDGIATGQTI